MNKIEIFLVSGETRRELSPREYDAVLHFGEDIVSEFPPEGPSGRRYVPTSEG